MSTPIGIERRRQILEGAKRVFAKRGYHDTNIGHICRDVGIARGTLYQYFDSKHQIFTHVVQGLLDRVRKFIDTTPKIELPTNFVPTMDDVLQYSQRSIKRCLNAVFEDEASLRIIVREAVGLDVRIDKIIRSIDDIVIIRFAEDIAAAQRLDVLRKDVEPRVAALFVLGGLQKLAIDALERKAPINLDKIARDATHLYMKGLLEVK